MGILYNLNKLFLNLCSRNIIKINDEKYLRLLYKFKMHSKLDLKNPKSFNEKLQWLKLNDRNNNYTTMVDKYQVKQYVANILGKEYIIPTLGIYNKFDEIDFDKLPNKFVIKCTHDSGGVIIVKDKKVFDKKAAKKKISKKLKFNYYYSCREWPYKNVKPRIIVEQYLKNDNGKELPDYKFFCFNGKVKMILVCSNRKGNYKNTNFYDTNWNLLPFTRKSHNNSLKIIERPHNLEEMINIAENLAKNIPFIRVDLYEVNNKVFFGELTFYPSSGFEGFNPDEWDKILGDMLELPNNKEEEKNEK
ncbi:MAG: glycosyl transferase [Clostridia bacterium]|nr:glycosyl transferase [Clostridia bacterium]